jgi:hypothetical protein
MKIDACLLAALEFVSMKIDACLLAAQEFLWRIMALLGHAHGALNLVCAVHNPLLWPSLSPAAHSQGGCTCSSSVIPFRNTHFKGGVIFVNHISLWFQGLSWCKVGCPSELSCDQSFFFYCLLLASV